MSRLHPLIRQLRKHFDVLVTQPPTMFKYCFGCTIAITMLASPWSEMLIALRVNEALVH